MEKVHFYKNSLFQEEADKAYSLHKEIMKERLPFADIQHVGSTAIPDSLTKGDLDIQVRVNQDEFERAVQVLATLYESNEGSGKTDGFRAFKDDSFDPPLGVQLTVKNSEFDFFWKFRDVLLMVDSYRKEYDDLKRKYEGKEMDRYRVAKNEFFQRIMETSEFKEL